jgi:hypothetical protein
MSRSRRVTWSDWRGRNDARIQHDMAEAMRHRAIGTGRSIVSRGRVAIVRKVVNLQCSGRLMGVKYLADYRLERQPNREKHQHGAAGEGHESVRSSSSNYGWDFARSQSE